ncbi:helix-turn-helix transcriptional regulator [Streptomyces daliensis]|uniref:Helix-turn-helix transcriptional regulator n=1 Tax=Streptomyces daliensis TaxID=299421 RepID=A0A8T4IPU0_9ACTN|nr:helix-turn-helix transcriptional regulator [Streptomyces daliensis]
MDGDDRRRRFGGYLAGLRQGTGLSQRQLAARLCTVSGTHSVTRNEVSRWERGERVPESWLPFLARALGVGPADMEQAAAYARGDQRSRPSSTRRRPGGSPDYREPATGRAL